MTAGRRPFWPVGSRLGKHGQQFVIGMGGTQNFAHGINREKNTAVDMSISQSLSFNFSFGLIF